MLIIDHHLRFYRNIMDIETEPEPIKASSSAEVKPVVLPPTPPTVVEEPARPPSRPRSQASSPLPRNEPPSESKAPTPAAVESRPLNVTDALSYLDAVKVQFQDKPEVYNRFLDIMKDFKSQVYVNSACCMRVTLFLW